jgi:6-phosphogluconate dehydrogenase (decarboxylating)
MNVGMIGLGALGRNVVSRCALGDWINPCEVRHPKER